MLKSPIVLWFIRELKDRVLGVESKVDDFETDLDSHTSATATNAHMAQNIGLEDSDNNFSSDELEGAMSELFTDLQEHKDDEGNPHNVNQTQVGLGNVDNLSAEDIRSGTTKEDVGLGNVDNVQQATKSEFDSHRGNRGTSEHSVATTSEAGFIGGNLNSIR